MSSNCWRCGEPTSEGRIECPTHNSVKVTHTDARFRLIDWNKVNTLDDMKRVLNLMGLRVLVGSGAWEQLREFLED